jgi:hypothetical protein
MKNSHIKPCQEVPLELRKQIYKEALEIVEDVKVEYDCKRLCFLLPKILWGFDSDNDSCYEKGLHFADTPLMFPELKKFLKKGTFYSYSNKQRIKFLKSVI